MIRPSGIAAAVFASALTLNGGTTHPRGAEPRGVSACTELGPGYHRIEGTDTCIRFGGSVRAEYEYGTGGSSRR